MKKCASCTKDLPDAALHCVFCGAKQQAAPLSPPSNAKTVMGYSANEMIEQLKASGQLPPGVGPIGQPKPAQEPPAIAHSPASPGTPDLRDPGSAPNAMSPSPQAAPYQPQMLPQTLPQTSHPGTNPPPMGGLVPNAAAGAATMFVTDAPPMGGVAGGGGGYQNPVGHAATLAAPPSSQGPTMIASSPAPMVPVPYVPPSSAGAGPQPMQQMQQMQPMQPMQPVAQPIAPIPSVTPPYLASQTAARAGRPIEPWKDSLRLLMFVFGVLLLASFATPISTDPLIFNWDAILHGEGAAKLGPLVLASIGVLTLVVGAIPMAPAGRGLIAAILGLSGIVVPIIVGGVFAWQIVAALVGELLLITGLVVRSEYRDATMPRIMVTIGALAVLSPLLVPAGGGGVPLVGLFQALIHAEGSAKIEPILVLSLVAVVVLSLLAWLPSPSSGGAKIWAWLLIMWTGITTVVMLLVQGGIGDIVSKSPYAVVAWAPLAAYTVLVGYGLASVLGKQLE